MQNDTATLEILPEEKGLLTVISESKIEPSLAENLANAFRPHALLVNKLVKQTVGVCSPTVAHAVRMELRTARVNIDKLRKAEKASSLLYGKVVEGMAACLELQIKGPEEAMFAIEKAEEIKEEARKAALKTEREAALIPFGVDVAFLSLGEMPDATFTQLLENSKAGHEAKIAAAAKIEADRIAAENARLKEEQRMREENSRLKVEAEAREIAARKERELAEAKLAEERAAAAKEAARVAEEQRLERLRLQAIAEAARVKAQAERESSEAAAKAAAEKSAKELAEIEAKAKFARESAEAQARKEREAREKVEAENAARIAAEKKKADAEKAAAAKAAAAPDKEKLLAFARAFDEVEAPALSTTAAIEVRKVAIEKLNALTDWLRTEANKL